MGTTINSLYTLTDMTGRRANDNRTVVVATIEMKSRHMVIVICSVIPGMLVMLMTLPAMGQWALVFPVVFVGIGFLASEARTRTGLKQRIYKDMLAKSKAHLNEFVLSGHPIDPGGSEFGVIHQTAVPLKPGPQADKTAFIDISGRAA